MGSYDPIGYVYEADVHCPYCARARFGDALDNPDTEDSEGNPIGAIAPWEETDPDGEYCGTCGREVAEPADDSPCSWKAGITADNEGGRA